jgi:hypothetical protein
MHRLIYLLLAYGFLFLLVASVFNERKDEGIMHREVYEAMMH